MYFGTYELFMVREKDEEMLSLNRNIKNDLYFAFLNCLIRSLYCYCFLFSLILQLLTILTRKTMFYSIYYKNLLKWKLACFDLFPTFTQSINFYTSYCHMTNHPNVHIYTFRKRWSFIWGSFFPASIFKSS